MRRSVSAPPKALPGEHVVLLTERPDDAVEWRLAGLELRDTILVLRSGPRASFGFLFRNPIAEGTVAAQVLKTGTGGLNVGACRIQSLVLDSERRTSATGGTRLLAFGMAAQEGERHNSEGRWPPNVVIIHAPACVRTGTKKIEASNAPGRASRGEGERAIGFGKNVGAARKMPFYTDPEDYGMETVAAYDCAPGCPVKILDEESGITTSGAMKHEVSGYDGESNTTLLRGRSGPSNQHGDTGGASRFFPQFESEAEFLGWLSKLMGQV